MVAIARCSCLPLETLTVAASLRVLQVAALPRLPQAVAQLSVAVRLPAIPSAEEAEPLIVRAALAAVEVVAAWAVEGVAEATQAVVVADTTKNEPVQYPGLLRFAEWPLLF